MNCLNTCNTCRTWYTYHQCGWIHQCSRDYVSFEIYIWTRVIKCFLRLYYLFFSGEEGVLYPKHPHPHKKKNQENKAKKWCLKESEKTKPVIGKRLILYWTGDKHVSTYFLDRPRTQIDFQWNLVSYTFNKTNAIYFYVHY